VLKSRFEHVLPADYDSAAVMMREAGDQLLARLDLVAMKPTRIMDVGCSIGYCAQLLQKRYPSAEVKAVDDSASMLAYAKESNSLSIHWLCTSLETLPAIDNSIDLLVANLVLPWCGDIKKMLQEWRRVLRPEGLLMFTTYGPDTLIELQEKNIRLPHLIDMHNIGDLLLQVGFADPVLDLDYFTLTYKEQQQLQDELKSTGMLLADDQIPLLEKNADQVFPLTYEIIHGHAWKPLAHPSVSAEGGVVKFPLAHLRGR